MISAIIDTLNTKLSLLTYFEKRYCLTELKTETKGETELTSPVHYVGSEDWEKIQVDKYRGVSYWRKGGTPSVERVDELGNAKDFVTVTFPIQLVGYVRRKDTTIDDEYSPDRIANALVKQLNFKNGELKTTLKAKRVISSVTDYSTDSAEIWEEETNGTGLADVPYKFAVVSLAVEIEVLARIDCLETECDQDSDILHAFDFCKPSVQDRLTATQITCLEDWICGEPDPVQIQVNGVDTETAESGTTYDQAIHDSAGDNVGTAANPSVVGDATVENSDASYSGTVKAEGNLVLPDITFTDSDGSTSSVPSVKDITATPCTPSASVSVSLDDDTPKLGQTVTITATVTGITPTSYTFYLPQQDGSFETVTQAGNTYDWEVSKYEDFTVTVTATDGSSEGVGTVDGTTTGDVDADAIITAQETAIGGTMDATAKDWVLGFMLRLKGIYTTFNENVFAQLEATNAELYAMFPDTSATASVAGYSINAIDPTRNATMVGFVSGDATVNGLEGGSGKYMIMNNAPSDYGQNDVGIGAYIRGSSTSVPIGGGDGDANDNTSGVSIFSGFSSDRIIAKCNSEDYLTLSSGNQLSFNTGFISLQRNVSDRFSPAKGGDAFTVIGLSSLTPSTQLFYGMAMNNNGTAARNYSGSVSCLINAPYLEECALKTLAEAVIWLQTQIGRNV